MRTTTGRNLDKLWKTGIDLDLINHSDSATDINLKIFNKKHQFAVTPYGEEYRLGILNDLLSLRTGYAFFEEDQFKIDEVNDMIAEICTS